MLISSYTYPSLGTYSTIFAILKTWFFFTLFYWILTGYGRYKVLKIYNYPYSWLAWIPFGSMFALSTVACEHNKKINMFGFEIDSDLFRLWAFLALLTSCIPFIGSVCYFGLNLLCETKVFQQIYARCENKTTEDTLDIGFLTGLFGIISVIKFLIYKPSKIKMENRYKQRPDIPNVEESSGAEE